MIFIYIWLAFGLGHYITMAVVNRKSFKGASAASIARGLLGIVFWPITLVVVKEQT